MRTHKRLGCVEPTNEGGAAHQEGLNTWAKLSSVEKVIEARKSKGSLQQKKGWRMKTPQRS
jgi:hypothetical protein